jgi:hypothetical protein
MLGVAAAGWLAAAALGERRRRRERNDGDKADQLFHGFSW